MNDRFSKSSGLTTKGASALGLPRLIRASDIPEVGQNANEANLSCATKWWLNIVDKAWAAKDTFMRKLNQAFSRGGQFSPAQ